MTTLEDLCALQRGLMRIDFQDLQSVLSERTTLQQARKEWERFAQEPLRFLASRGPASEEMKKLMKLAWAKSSFETAL